MSRLARQPSRVRSIPWILVGLAVLTIAVYARVGWHSFVNYDDPILITGNPRVLLGLTWENIAWAFTATQGASFWHPLTWVSHMADVQLFGLNAGGHHLMSVAIHGLNSMVLFVILLRATGSAWRSGLVAALFAVHPLHVESVAWASERKDVLSTLFLFLTLGAYTSYAARPSVGRYLGVVLLFGMSLMSKSMGVTLPFVLLLLDCWPLSRIAESAPRAGAPRRQYPLAPWKKLLGEKVPLLVMAAGSAAITLQHKSESSWVSSLQDYPLSMRAANAVVSYATYLWKTVCPMSLAAFYPHPATTLGYLPAWKTVTAILLLGGLSLLALRQVRRRPYLMVGWLWYLGMLVPVIGLVQVSHQAMADRFTYVPLVGIFIAVAWAIPEVSRRGRFRKTVVGVFAGGSLAALSIAAWVQTGYWRDSITLFSHTLEVTDSNWVALNIMCGSHNKLGQYEQAIGYCQESLRIRPNHAEAWNNLGFIYSMTGQHQQGISCYREALRTKPGYAEAHNNIGASYHELGQYRQAIEYYREAVRLKPDYVAAWNNLGRSYSELGQYQQAMASYRETLKLSPDNAEARKKLAALGGKPGQRP